jgi:hypothetical protein
MLPNLIVLLSENIIHPAVPKPQVQLLALGQLPPRRSSAGFPSDWDQSKMCHPNHSLNGDLVENLSCHKVYTRWGRELPATWFRTALDVALIGQPNTNIANVPLFCTVGDDDGRISIVVDSDA